MTTIAYRNGVLAVDQSASGSALRHAVSKLSRGIHPRLGAMAIAWSGGLFFVRAMEAAIFAGDPLPSAKDYEIDLGVQVGLGLTYDGALYDIGAGGVISRNFSPFAGLGSGGQFVEGAMAAGVGAVEALQLAFRLTSEAGIGIEFASLDDLMAMQAAHLDAQDENAKATEWAQGYVPPEELCTIAQNGFKAAYDPDVEGARDLCVRILDNGGAVPFAELDARQLTMMMRGAVRVRGRE